MAKSVGKKLALNTIKQVSPKASQLGSIIDDVAGLIESPGAKAAAKAAGTLPGVIGDIALKDLLGAGLAVYSNPTQIADDPMEGTKGWMAEQYRSEHVDPYRRGELVGPEPDPDTQVKEFGKIWENHLQENERYAAERKKKEEEESKRKLLSNSTWAAQQLMGLITGLGAGL